MGYDNGTFGIGRLTSMSDPSGSSAYAYDRRGLLLSDAKTIQGSTYTTYYTYEADGRRNQITYPSARVVDYTYDYAGRPYSAASGATSYVTSTTYLPFGPASQLVSATTPPRP